MSELQIDRSNRSVAWRSSPGVPGFELELKSENGVEFIVNTDDPKPILKLYNLAVRLYLNGETVPRQRLWCESILRARIDAADKAAERVTV